MSRRAWSTRTFSTKGIMKSTVPWMPSDPIWAVCIIRRRDSAAFRKHLARQKVTDFAPESRVYLYRLELSGYVDLYRL
jgi:hypothetical protein